MPSMIDDVKYDPPRLIPSLMEGFNTVASNLYIILFPVGIDILLWLGPMVRVKKFFLPLLLEAAEVSSGAYSDQTVQLVDAAREVWTYMLDQFNLLFSLRTFPIGIPSLMIKYVTNSTPLGNPMIIDLESGNMIFAWLLILLMIGLLLGSIYFALVADLAIGKIEILSIKQVASRTLQALFLAIILLLVISILSLPVSCLLSSFMLVLPSLGSLPLILMGMVAVWMILPLAFTPHGIYSSDLKVGKSIVTSFRLVRSLMSPTGLFFITLILLGSGLDILWSTPESNNWMLLVGIIGHGFISSGLLAASFIYYDQGVKWLKNTVQSEKHEKPSVV